MITLKFNQNIISRTGELYRINFLFPLQLKNISSFRMAHEMPEYLVPPPRTAILGRALTDPASMYDDRGSSGGNSSTHHFQHHHQHSHLGVPGSAAAGAAATTVSPAASHHGSAGQLSRVPLPASPPPAYSEVIKEVR